MSLQIRIAFRDNIPASTRRAVMHEASILAQEGAPLLTAAQIQHLTPQLARGIRPRLVVENRL